MEPIDRYEALEVLKTAPVAHLGVIDGDRPYVTPMSFVLSGERLLFRTMGGRKLEALRQSPQVCVEVSDLDASTGDWVSVIAYGDAAEVADDALKTLTVSLLFDKYDEMIGSPFGRNGGLRAVAGFPHVIEVPIDELSGMCSGRGFSARTRPGRL